MSAELEIKVHSHRLIAIFLENLSPLLPDILYLNILDGDMFLHANGSPETQVLVEPLPHPSNDDDHPAKLSS